MLCLLEAFWQFGSVLTARGYYLSTARWPAGTPRHHKALNAAKALDPLAMNSGPYSVMTLGPYQISPWQISELDSLPMNEWQLEVAYTQIHATRSNLSSVVYLKRRWGTCCHLLCHHLASSSHVVILYRLLPCELPSSSPWAVCIVTACLLPPKNRCIHQKSMNHHQRINMPQLMSTRMHCQSYIVEGLRTSSFSLYRS